MSKLNLSAPWVTLYHEYAALFGCDPEIAIVYDEDAHIIKLYVDNAYKADALTQLLPPEYDFGNIIVHVEVIPSNESMSSPTSIFEAAFANNPVFAFTKSAEGIFSDIFYVVFKNKVVQYFNDNLGDVYGNCSTLYQDIAKNVFGDHTGVYFCTDIEEKVGAEQ